MSDISKRLTKIVSTIGPACEHPETLENMLKAGLNVVRMNFSHGSHEEHQKRIDSVHKLREKYNFGIALDTKGPEIRLINVDKPISVEKGMKLCFFTGEQPKVEAEHHLQFNFGNYKGLTKGFEFSVDDNQLRVEVTDICENYLIGIAQGAHLVKSKKSCNFPGVPLGLKFLSEKDQSDIKFGLKNNCDIIFASFVSTKKDIDEMQAFVTKHANHKPLVFSKIENLEAMGHLDEITIASDGIMVARGDLGAETKLEGLFTFQKMITETSIKHGKPFIVATQMIESMCEKDKPTRAEITDVGYAVYTFADGVMTSGETAAGKFPVETVKMMVGICEETEKYMKKECVCISTCKNICSQSGCSPNSCQPNGAASQLSTSCCSPNLTYSPTSLESTNVTMGIKSMASSDEVKLIVVQSDSLSVIQIVYAAMTNTPIVAFTTKKHLIGQLCVFRGIYPRLLKSTERSEQSEERIKCMKTEFGLKKGDQFLLYANETKCCEALYLSRLQ